MVSVIVPIYRVEKYLERCIQSIINQNYTDLEIILVDDGSPDLCPQMCDEYAKTDSRIKVIHKENGGLSDARNRGIQEAAGEYITFVDSDDYIHPEMISGLLRNLQKVNADISVCGYNIIYDDRVEVPLKRGKMTLFSRKDAIREMMLNPKMGDFAWNKMFKRHVFDEICFPIGHTAEDIAVMYTLFQKCNQIVFDETPWYNYYQRDNSIVHGLNKSFFKDLAFFSYERYCLLKKIYPDMSENDTATVIRLMNAYSYLYPDRECKRKLKKVIKNMSNEARNLLDGRWRWKFMICKVSTDMYALVMRFGRKVKGKKMR